MTRPFVGTILPEDYAEIVEGVKAAKITAAFFIRNGARIDVSHEHRYWEYGSALEALIQVFNSRLPDIEVLDVGAGVGLMGPALALMYSTKVLECEPDMRLIAFRAIVNKHLQEMKKTEIQVLPIGFGKLPKKQFDAVTCISVLEHVKDELDAWKELLERVKPKGVLFITTDCVPDASKEYKFDMLRANNYTLDKLKERVELAKQYGFTTMGNPDWNWNGCRVYDYSFFRCGLIRN